MDLVDRGISDDQSISPVRTWSVHHLPVTSLQPLPSGRMISVSEDGQLVMMELFSETTLMTLQLKNGIQSLAFHDGRIYAGSIQGTIFCIDVNVFAMQQTAQLGVTIKRRRLDETHVDQIYMTDKSEAYKSELCGHEKMVTSLAILAEDSTNVWLVSGDAAGTLRVWDLATRGCVRVIQPWSHSVRTTSSLEESATSTLHPITSILVVPHEQDDIGVGTFSSQKEAKANGISNLVTPLERFSEGKAQALPVPFLSPKRDADTLASWDDTSSSITFQPRVEAAGDDPDDEKVEKADRSDKDNSELNNQRQLVKRLQHELDEAQATIARWEKVNDKLMTKPSKIK
jgi:hypothetical protein